MKLLYAICRCVLVCVCRVVGCGSPPRRRSVFVALVAAALLSFTIIVYTLGSDTFAREDAMDSKLVHMEAQLSFLETLYRQRYEHILALQGKSALSVNTSKALRAASASAAVARLIAKYAGTKTAAGFENLKPLRMPVMYHLMPHLLDDGESITPAFHMTQQRHFVDVVIGVPTVKRDKINSYWLETLQSLVTKLSEAEKASTLIVLFIGETDLEYVTDVANKVEIAFPQEVSAGLIEVMSPSPSYYPDLDKLPLTLGDSLKRVKWRTKQNLDTMFLMGYAQAMGTYYLMLEDDVVAKDNFMKKIKAFTTRVSVVNPEWFYIDFCSIGGIGKLFRSPDVLHFITFVQLFYYHKPIDWLLECYLADRVCSINTSSKDCGAKKAVIRPQHKKPLFEHIGLYSSLKGKIHDVKGGHGVVPEYFPHSSNPPVASIRCPLEIHLGHSIEAAYTGQTYFWGNAPLNGTTIEFVFKEPTVLESYLIRSGNVKHKKDIFYDSVVEVLPVGGNYSAVGRFDEFGLAEGELRGAAPLAAVRIRVMRSSTYWVIISEIELRKKFDYSR